MKDLTDKKLSKTNQFSKASEGPNHNLPMGLNTKNEKGTSSYCLWKKLQGHQNKHKPLC